MAIKGKNRGIAYQNKMFRTMSIIVLIASDWKCEACSMVSISNEVHHCNHDNQSNHPSNLMVLCKSCHAQVTRSKILLMPKWIELNKSMYTKAIETFNNLQSAL